VDAVEANQVEVAGFYRTRLDALGDTAAGRAAAKIQGEFVLRVKNAASELRLYRCALQSQLVEGGEPRMVPATGSPSLAPGTWALELTADAAPLHAGDLIVEVGGHAIEGAVLVARGAGEIQPLDRLVSVDGKLVTSLPDARLLGAQAEPPNDGTTAVHRFSFVRNGATFSVQAESLGALDIVLANARDVAVAGDRARVQTPKGIVAGELPKLNGLRPTALPVLLGEAVSVMGADEAHRVNLDPGVYLAVVSGSGRLSVRVLVRVPPGEQVEIWVPLPAAGSAPPGFVPVHNLVSRVFFLMQHEVTCGQYLEFLSHPEVAPRVEAAVGAALVPRLAVTDGWRPIWHRDALGALQLPAGTEPDHPVTCVTWNDAVAYAEWATRRLREQGYNVTCALPSHEDWVAATGPVGQNWLYVFGPHFRPKWTLSNFAHRRPALGNVMTHPVDASVAGVFDLAGSVMEWSAGWFWEDMGWRTFRCGAWSYAKSERFETQFAQAELPDSTMVSLGFRLMARPDE
jgi:formylglycine-generating enzyme required for sulfatase activity